MLNHALNVCVATSVAFLVTSVMPSVWAGVGVLFAGGAR